MIQVSEKAWDAIRNLETISRKLVKDSGAGPPTDFNEELMKALEILDDVRKQECQPEQKR